MRSSHSSRPLASCSRNATLASGVPGEDDEDGPGRDAGPQLPPMLAEGLLGWLSSF